MTPQEMQELAELLQTVPGIKSIDLKDVRKLAQLLRESPEIGSIEIKGWFGTGVVITRTLNSAHPPTVLAPMPMVPHMTAIAPTRAAGEHYVGAGAPAAGPAVQSALKEIRSPMVGTFFRSPDPNSPAFVNTGDRVKVGQVLCIIEAMKLMNEIEAEVAGEIAKVHHENGQPVQYGEALFSIRPDR